MSKWRRRLDKLQRLRRRREKIDAAAAERRRRQDEALAEALAVIGEKIAEPGTRRQIEVAIKALSELREVAVIIRDARL